MSTDTRTTWVLYSVAEGKVYGVEPATRANAEAEARMATEHQGSPFDAETLESAQRRALDFKLGAASLVTSP